MAEIRRRIATQRRAPTAPIDLSAMLYRVMRMIEQFDENSDQLELDIVFEKVPELKPWYQAQNISREKQRIAIAQRVYDQLLPAERDAINLTQRPR